MKTLLRHSARVVTALTLLVAACARSDGDVIERDSAGVRLVVNTTTGAGWKGETPWRVTEELAIGSDTLSDEYRFGRIGDLAVTPNGNIAVIDQLASVVRVFDARGRFIRSVGRPGKGPGELSINSNGIYALPGDSLLVLDPGERRMTVFAPDGTVGRVTALPPTPTGQGWLRLPDGRFLMRGLTIGRAEGRFTFWDALLAVEADGSATDTLFIFDHAKTDLGGPGRIRIQLIVNNPTWARLGDGRIAWTADTHSHADYISGITPNSDMVKADDYKIAIHGNTAIMTHRSTVQGVRNIQFRSTHVWMKRGGKWLIIAHHGSQITPEPAEEQ